MQFLKRINYDHRQCPENKAGGSGPIFVEKIGAFFNFFFDLAVEVEVSVVVSNIRAVSEVTMVTLFHDRILSTLLRRAMAFLVGRGERRKAYL